VHESSCPEAQIECPNVGCGVTVARRSMEEHRGGCGREEVECPCPGCDERVARAEVEEHMAASGAVHLRRAWGRAVEMEEKVAEMEEKVVGLQTKVAEQDSVNTALQRLAEALTRTVARNTVSDPLLPPVTRSSEGLFSLSWPAVADSSPLPPKREENQKFVVFVVEVPRSSPPSCRKMSDRPPRNAPAPGNYGLFAANGNRAAAAPAAPAEVPAAPGGVTAAAPAVDPPECAPDPLPVAPGFMTGAVLPGPAAGGGGAVVVDNRVWVYRMGFTKSLDLDRDCVSGGAGWIVQCPACLKGVTGSSKLSEAASLAAFGGGERNAIRWFGSYELPRYSGSTGVPCSFRFVFDRFIGHKSPIRLQ